ncbi:MULTISPECIES: transporter substrate-binding domain-containing protein [unclassified Kitasatospora]|uniref:transporter substrate-binding domain-containing protein n=1 Tax=unclassified Kitasatospora TaxID=2633591 RepID=UPI0033F04E44
MNCASAPTSTTSRSSSRTAAAHPSAYPDLAAALGSYLGLRVRFLDMAFNDLIPAVQSGKIDLAMSAVIDSRDRQQGKDTTGHVTNPSVDFVDYFLTGTSILVKAGNPQGLTTLDSLCGHTIAVQTNSVQIKVAKAQSAACTRSGKPLRIDSVNTDDQAVAEVSSGTAAADLEATPVPTTTPLHRTTQACSNWSAATGSRTCTGSWSAATGATCPTCSPRPSTS